MTYRVTAGYVTVTTAVGPGRALIDIPRGEHVPGDVPAEEIERLLTLGHVAAVPADEPAEEPSPRPRKRATKAG